ncbi:MAG: hypothetical protein VB108_09185 [Anaerolineaceae bacterium]|nr:hypothetical protein [Anaerolineaceae bacterium]
MPKNLVFNKTLGIIAVVIATSLVFLGVNYSFYIYLFCIGTLFSCVIFEKSQIDPFFHFLTGIFWGSAILILTAGILSLCGILLRKWVLIIPAFLVVIFLLKNKSDTLLNIKQITLSDFLILGFALVSLFSHVFSIRGFVAPILHDPINHATWAKEIFNTGRIDYFYSPGLHILAAFGMMVDNINVATYILRLTNIFTALLFIPAYYFLKTYFGSKRIANIGASLFLIGHFPTNLFFTAGKNALILGASFFLLLLTLLKLNFGKWTKLIVYNLLIFVIILTHYPLAAIGITLIVGYILFERNLKALLLGIGGSALGALWGVQKYHFQVSNQQTSMFESVNPIPFTLSGLYKFFESSFISFKSYFASTYHLIFFFLGIASFFIIVILCIREKKYRGFVGMLVFFLLLAIAINSIYLLRNSVYIIYMTQQNMFAILIYFSIAICAGLLFDYLSFFVKSHWINLISACVLISVVFLASINTYFQYRRSQAQLNIVSQNDLLAYQWIKSHLHKEDIILNNAAQNQRTEVIYGSDGGTWIPVFSDRSVAMPFTEFSDKSTHEIYSFYQKIRDGSSTCSDYESLLNHGVTYYYQDSQGMYGPQILAQENKVNFNLVYSNLGITIYQIEKCP